MRERFGCCCLRGNDDPFRHCSACTLPRVAKNAAHLGLRNEWHASVGAADNHVGVRVSGGPATTGLRSRSLAECRSACYCATPSIAGGRSRILTVRETRRQSSGVGGKICPARRRPARTPQRAVRNTEICGCNAHSIEEPVVPGLSPPSLASHSPAWRCGGIVEQRGRRY